MCRYAFFAAFNKCDVFGYFPQRCHPSKHTCTCDENYLSITSKKRNTTLCYAKGKLDHKLIVAIYDVTQFTCSVDKF